MKGNKGTTTRTDHTRGFVVLMVQQTSNTYNRGTETDAPAGLWSGHDDVGLMHELYGHMNLARSRVTSSCDGI